MNKHRIFFRVFPFNILSYPPLLHTWERNNIDREFEIIIIPGREALKRIKFNKDDVLLYSAMTPFLPRVHGEILSIGKNSAVDINGAGCPLIAIGGPHANGEQDLAFAIGCDIIFAGHAEDSFLRFAHDLLGNKITR
ncbi:MAG: cobalamin B12-binding domain-containing protein, partial [Candidatus Aminicenantes bacterium]|nr:cobalamin B12-binding domain-containing protein [Candidatus Aminicenantes bacterium]